MHFVFQQHIRTRLTALCTEKDHPYLPSLAYVRYENKEPARVLVQAKVGNNTYLDQRSRLVHESDVSPAGPQSAPPFSSCLKNPSRPRRRFRLRNLKLSMATLSIQKGRKCQGLPPRQHPNAAFVSAACQNVMG